MKFYQVHLTHDAGVSAGFEYFTNRRDAEACAAAWRKDHKGVDADDGSTGATVEEIEVETNRTGILRALKFYASHPDNG